MALISLRNNLALSPRCRIILQEKPTRVGRIIHFRLAKWAEGNYFVNMQYKGLNAIAKRLGVSTGKLRRRYKELQYPMYIMRGVGTRILFVSNDQLIALWEQEQIKRCAENYKPGQRRQDRLARKDYAA